MMFDFDNITSKQTLLQSIHPYSLTSLIKIHHVGCVLKVACHSHLMTTLHKGMHGVKRLYLGTSCEEAGDANKGFHFFDKMLLYKMRNSDIWFHILPIEPQEDIC